jgi:hypothetical protein
MKEFLIAVMIGFGVIGITGLALVPVYELVERIRRRQTTEPVLWITAGIVSLLALAYALGRLMLGE